MISPRQGPTLTAACGLLLLVMLRLTTPAHGTEAPATAAGNTANPGDDRAAVLAVVTRLFDGMRERSEETLRAVFAPGARLGRQEIDDFIRAVVGGTRYLDEVTFDETVLIDGDLAMAWTPYNIFIDGTFHHCGVDLFVMRRLEGAWRITHLDDTRRTEDCDPERRS